MVSAVIYRPGSKYVNSEGKPHMAALVVSFQVEGTLYQCPLWIAQDDLPDVSDRAWLRSHVVSAFETIVDDILPQDIPHITPTKEDELDADGEADVED